MNWSNARAVLFDFDGTLVHQTVDFALMRRLVLELVAVFGLSAEDYADMYVLELVERAAQELASRGASGAAFREQAHAAVLRVELDAARHANLFPGVHGLLTGLHRAGYGIGIVTRNCRAAVELVLAKAPLEYDILLTRDDVTHTKPDPRHLMVALDHLNVAGHEAIMCGDHPMDVLVGHRIGAGTVAVLGDNLPEHFREVSPDLMVGRITELSQHLLTS